MGKRTKNLSGLSRFAKQAFQQSPAPDSSSKAIAESSANRHGETATEKSLRHESLGSSWHAYDATRLVPHYKTASEVPEHLQKYFAQRKRYFTLYDEGCLLDEEGWYSVTPELIAAQIAERCRCDTILDAFCGVGGNAIAFAKTCEHVIALDISPVRLALAKHNAVIYGVADRIEFILGDYISFAQAYISRSLGKRSIDVVFLSPPWGGPGYLLQGNNDVELVSEQTDASPEGHPEFSLANIKPIHGADLFHLSRKITHNVAYFLPRNASLEEISALLTESAPVERVEVEEEWMGTKLKALTCYFGGLAYGQQQLF
ncbi:RNA cap guanine-N2 methyltransferase-domain-containing protein [Boletus edulis BED1]|uniref:Trimethylguanosine synthase n=1 Tax=Boletus edulis BED1 TaxID=1328754 RepID=A0AAD4C554_BOLED|nr:RNA cap guanine-N2 methyltransferase-domain-containing protein [Boletus edulis BED1]